MQDDLVTRLRNWLSDGYWHPAAEIQEAADTIAAQSARIDALTGALQGVIADRDRPDVDIDQENAAWDAARSALAPAETVLCPNCDAPMPEGCGGTFKESDGDQCWLNRREPPHAD